MNWLRQLLNPQGQQAPSMPVNPQGPPPPYQMPQGGNLDAMLGGGGGNLPSNVLQQMQQPTSAPAVEMPQQQETMTEAPRKRRSFLDTIGGISDVIARVGGAEALYQPTLDAREDRARQVDVDAMNNQLTQQRITQGEQTLEAGKGQLADTERARLGNMLGAFATNPEIFESMDEAQIAEQYGINPQMLGQVKGLIQGGIPAENLARSFGWTPETKTGSQAKELQVYQMLQGQDPELAKSYLQSIANPDSLSEYQRAQLAISLEGLGLRREEFEADEFRADEEATQEAATQEAAGGADLTAKQRGDVTMKLKLLPNARAQFQRVRQLYNDMVDEGTLARGPLGGLVPTALSGPKAETFDKAAGALRKSIQTLTRIPGVGTMTNYETLLDEQALPTRWGSDEGRAEAINGIGVLLDNYESGYRDMLGSQPAARPAARPAQSRSRGAPAPAARSRRSVSPAAAEARRRGLRD